MSKLNFKLGKGIMLSIFWMISLMISAQSTVTVTGTVKDNFGEELIGVSILVEGVDGHGTVTDFD